MPALLPRPIPVTNVSKERGERRKESDGTCPTFFLAIFTHRAHCLTRMLALQEDSSVLLVKSVLKGSPANQTGLVRVGDAVSPRLSFHLHFPPQRDSDAIGQIVSVDGTDCYGFSLAELAERLLGHPGTEVVCRFRNQ